MKFTEKGDLEFTNKELAKQKIREILDKGPVCKVCGAELPRYSFYSDEYEWRTCPKCKTTFKKRRFDEWRKE